MVLTLRAVDLHGSPFAVGAVMGLLGAVPIFIAVPVGRWVDVSGFVRPTLLGLSMQAGGNLLATLWPAMGVLGVASLAIGAGFSLCFVSMNNAVGHATSDASRANAFGIVALVISIANLVGPPIAGFLIDHVGHRLAFAAFLLPPLASAVTLLLPGIPRVPTPGARGAGAASRGSVLDLFRDPPLRAVLIVSGLFSIGWDTFQFLMPLYGTARGLSATAIGVVLGAFGAGTIAVRLGIPLLMRVTDAWRVLCAALGIGALFYVVVPMSSRLSTLLPLAFGFGSVLGSSFPLAMSLVHEIAPPARTGEAVGVRAVMTSSSHALLPMGFGAIGTAVGLTPLFWATAALLASGGFYAARMKRGRAIPRAQAGPPVELAPPLDQ